MIDTMCVCVCVHEMIHRVVIISYRDRYRAGYPPDTRRIPAGYLPDSPGWGVDLGRLTIRDYLAGIRRVTSTIRRVSGTIRWVSSTFYFRLHTLPVVYLFFTQW